MLPVLFELNLHFLGLGTVAVRTYSLFLLLAFIAAIIVFHFILKKRTLMDTGIVTDLAFWVIIGVVVGSRLAYVFMHWPEFKDAPQRIFAIWEGGAVYYGGFILAFIAGGIYVWAKKLPIFPLLDSIAPVVALGEGIGRFGCFFNGCCFGNPTDVCGITFPEHSLASFAFGPDHSIWPTQLFQAGGGLLLFGILLLLMQIKSLRKGQLFGFFLLGFGGLRFGVNFFRYYENDLNLWTNQIIALGLMAAGIGFVVLCQFIQQKVPSPARIAAERAKMLAKAKEQEKKPSSKKKSSKRKGKH